MIQIKTTENRVIRHSDRNVKILQIETGIPYDNANDALPCKYTYEETNIPISTINQEIDDSEALDIILGRNAG